MSQGKSVGEDSANTAVSGSSSLNETPTYQVPEGAELPPPYSQVPLSSQNQPFVQNPVQQQYVWNPQGSHTFPQPAAPGPQPFQYGAYPPQGGTAPVIGVHVMQGSAVRQGIPAGSAVLIQRGAYRRSFTSRLVRLGIVFLLMGIVLLVALGIVVVHPALNDEQLQSSYCTAVSSKYTDMHVSCDCGRYCTSHYPCLQIRVSFSAKGKEQRAYLYDDVYADKNKCAMQPCSSFGYSNIEDVDEFRTSYGVVGQSYTCYYNPKTPDEVFKSHASLSSDNMKIMHCILWPFLIILFSVTLLAVLFCRSKGFFCFKKPGSSVPYQNMEPRA